MKKICSKGEKTVYQIGYSRIWSTLAVTVLKEHGEEVILYSDIPDYVTASLLDASDIDMFTR